MIHIFTEIDHQLFVYFNQTLSNVYLDHIMHFLSSKWALIPIYVVVLFQFVRMYKKKFWVPLVLCLIAFGLADSVSTRIFKPVFKRTRPAFCENIHPRLPDGKPGSQYGFVSSHAANTFAVYPLMVVIIFGMNHLKKRRQWLMASIIFASLVSISRIYNGVHWPADVLGGAILGYLIFLLSAKIWENKLKHFATHK